MKRYWIKFKRTFHHEYIILGIFFVFALLNPRLQAEVIETQLQIIPYYDSNLKESLSNTYEGYGLKLRSRIRNSQQFGKVNLSTRILFQGYFEANIVDESKGILLPSIDLTYLPSNNTLISLDSEIFYKRFFSGKRVRVWSDINASIRTTIGKNVQGIIQLRYRPELVENIRVYRYDNFTAQSGLKFNIDRNTTLQGAISYLAVKHHDFLARELSSNRNIISLDIPQRDYGIRAVLHVQYRSAMIFGIHMSGENIKSNSVIGEYNQIRFEPYLSGYIGSKLLYHLAIQFSHKQYEFPDYDVVAGYRDPEGPAQNRAHVRVERLFSNKLLGFLQVSIFRNESVIVSRYYNKTIAEFGLEYSL